MAIQASIYVWESRCYKIFDHTANSEIVLFIGTVVRVARPWHTPLIHELSE